MNVPSIAPTRRLALLCNAFPYGTWEPYLETELPYLDGFDRVDLFAPSVRPDQRKTRRHIDLDNVVVHAIPYRSRLRYALGGLRALATADFYHELRRMVRGKNLTTRRLVKLLVVISRGTSEAGVIARVLRRSGLRADEAFLLYSYRMEYHSYVVLRLKRAFPAARVVLRGHRYDLYEEMSPGGFIPLRDAAFRVADRILPVSDHGADYLRARFPEAAERITVRRLGTTDLGLAPIPPQGGPLRIITISTITTAKRLDRLVKALTQLDRPAEWDHFGDGPLRPDLLRAIAELPTRVQVRLRGEVSHDMLMAHLQEVPYDVLVNVSDSEGVPVSIMEAMSLGIPVVATAAGGTGEIVSDGRNGYLISPPFEPERIADALRLIADSDFAQVSRLRSGARESWRSQYSAEINHGAFVEDLFALLEAASAAPDRSRSG